MQSNIPNNLLVEYRSDSASLELRQNRKVLDEHKPVELDARRDADAVIISGQYENTGIRMMFRLI